MLDSLISVMAKDFTANDDIYYLLFNTPLAGLALLAIYLIVSGSWGLWEGYQMERGERVSTDLSPERVITEKQLKRLLSIVKATKGEESQDYLMFAIMANTGLRIAETAALTVGDIDTEERRLTVQHGKGNRRGVVNYGEKTAELFTALFALRRFNLGNQPLFLNQRGKQLTTDGIYWLFLKYRDLAGLPKSLTPHSLRHRTACYLLDQGVPLSAVKETLRHSNISVTSLYLHLTQDNLERLRAVL